MEEKEVVVGKRKMKDCDAKAKHLIAKNSSHDFTGEPFTQTHDVVLGSQGYFVDDLSEIWEGRNWEPYSIIVWLLSREIYTWAANKKLLSQSQSFSISSSNSAKISGSCTDARAASMCSPRMRSTVTLNFGNSWPALGTVRAAKF